MTQGSLQGKVNQSFPRRHALIEQPLSAITARSLSLMCRAYKNGRNLLTQVFSYEQFVRFIDAKEQKLGVLEIMSNKVAEVLGERLGTLSKGQRAPLNRALGQMFGSHQGQASQVTEGEIEGAYSVMEMF